MSTWGNLVYTAFRSLILAPFSAFLRASTFSSLPEVSSPSPVVE